MERVTYENVDQYIADFPEETQILLQQIRSIIKKIVPEATETISYKIPAYFYHGVLFYFAGFKNHVSLYPAPRSEALFEKELQAYKGGKGTIQFPLNKPLPMELIERLLVFKKQKNEKKTNSH